MSTATSPQLPRNCTFSPTDWAALAPCWHPVAFSHEVTATQPFAARLLDERLVLFRAEAGHPVAARDLCLHRGAPLSLGAIASGELVCAYHGLRYGPTGRCVAIPAAPNAKIPDNLCLTTYPVREQYGLVWVQLVENEAAPFPVFAAWEDPDYLQVLPDAVPLAAAAGRQVEGFLDVSHFAFVHKDSFGEPDNAIVPDYPITQTDGGFIADYVSSVSNLPHGFKHLNPPGFKWRRRFQVWLPFTVTLSVTFPEGMLHILNAACPVSARQTRVFSPLCRNFDKEAPLEATLAFNHQIFAEDKAIVETLWPEDLPINLADEVHIAGDKSSIAYRKRLANLGLGRSFTA